MCVLLDTRGVAVKWTSTSVNPVRVRMVGPAKPSRRALFARVRSGFLVETARSTSANASLIHVFMVEAVLMQLQVTPVTAFPGTKVLAARSILTNVTSTTPSVSMGRRVKIQTEATRASACLVTLVKTVTPTLMIAPLTLVVTEELVAMVSTAIPVSAAQDTQAKTAKR